MEFIYSRIAKEAIDKSKNILDAFPALSLRGVPTEGRDDEAISFEVLFLESTKEITIKIKVIMHIWKNFIESGRNLAKIIPNIKKMAITARDLLCIRYILTSRGEVVYENKNTN